MKVVSYEDLFGDNDFISYYEIDTLIKNNVKYLPLDIVCRVGFHYETENVQEVEF